jgi:HTH-type transcriptional regulator / antitoxin MqsA
MKCPSCGMMDLVREVRDVPFIYKGKSLTVPAQPGEYCSVCGESVWDDSEAARYEAVIQPFIVAVNNAGMPDLRAIRKRLRLTQSQAGKYFGGGVTAFSRYESGKTAPPVALVKLLKLLDHHPELLEEAIHV